MDINSLIRGELLVLMPLLVGLGATLKRWDWLKDEWIPYVLMGASVVVVMSYCAVFFEEGSLKARLATGAVQGVLLAVAAVGGHQCFKQAQKLSGKEDGEEADEKEDADLDKDKQENAAE